MAGGVWGLAWSDGSLWLALGEIQLIESIYSIEGTQIYLEGKGIRLTIMFKFDRNPFKL